MRNGVSFGGGWKRGTEIILLGKEANNLDCEPLDGGNIQEFGNPEKEMERIRNMGQCDVEREGINWGTRWWMKNKSNN